MFYQPATSAGGPHVGQVRSESVEIRILGKSKAPFRASKKEIDDFFWLGRWVQLDQVKIRGALAFILRCATTNHYHLIMYILIYLY